MDCIYVVFYYLTGHVFLSVTHSLSHTDGLSGATWGSASSSISTRGQEKPVVPVWKKQVEAVDHQLKLE